MARRRRAGARTARRAIAPPRVYPTKYFRSGCCRVEIKCSLGSVVKDLPAGRCRMCTILEILVLPVIAESPGPSDNGINCATNCWSRSTHKILFSAVNNILTGSLVWWVRRQYGFGIPCRYPKPIGKYGITVGMSVYTPNNPGIRGTPGTELNKCT